MEGGLDSRVASAGGGQVGAAVGERGGYSWDRAALVSNGDGAPREESGWSDVDVAGRSQGVKMEYGDILG